MVADSGPESRVAASGAASGLPTTGKKARNWDFTLNNEGLDQWEISVEKAETICLASIFGGTSID